MGTSHLKSAYLTALGSTPYGDLASSGLGAAAYLRSVSGFATPLASDAAGSTYQLVRVPTSAVIKKVLFSSQAQGAGKVQLSVYYSSAVGDGGPQDGTPPSLSTSPPTVVPTTGAAFFSGDIDISSAVGQTDYTFANAANSGSYAQNLINEPLWQALGLSSDPGGFFDIVAVVHTTAITTGTGVIALQADYTY